MKTIQLCVLMLTVAIIPSCEKFHPFKGHHPKKITVPFRAEFLTTLTSLDTTKCGPDPRMAFDIQDGHGAEKNLGSFTTRITFCVNLNTLEYFDAQGSFVFSNGDEIFVTGGGRVVPSDDPNYRLMFKDPFKIIGGTGRFKGAKGNLVTDSYVDFAMFQTDHVWTGEITLHK